MRKQYSFTATVTDLDTGNRRKVADTVSFKHPVSRADALTAISNELARQRRPGTGITITN